jgi:hypothetical protein
MVGGWRNPHNEKLHNLNSSPSIIRMIKSRMVRWAGHTVRMGRRRIHIGFWWESQEQIDHYEHLGVGERIILKWILEKLDGVV